MAENLDPEVVTRLTEAYREQYELMRDNTLIGKAKADAEKAETNAKAASLIVFRNSIKAVEDFTRTLATQESSFQKFTALGTQVVDTAASMAKEMGGLTGAMGVALQAAIKVAHAMAVQADAIVKTKDQIAKFGAVGELSSKELQDLANKAGYFSLNMNKLYAAAGKAGGDLLIFSKNMSEGVKTFAGMASFGGELDETLAKFNMLGIGSDELREYQSDYVKYLAASGVQLNANQKTQAALTKGSLEYTKNVLELSALTGKDVDTVKKKQQEAQASLDIMLRHNKMQAQADELRAQKNFEGAKAIEDQVAKEKAIINAVSAQYSSAMTASVRSAIATGGSLNDLNRNLGNMGIDPRAFEQMAKDSTMTAGQAAAAALETVAGGVKYASTIFRDSIIHSAGSQDELAKTVFGTVEDLQQGAKGAGQARTRQEEIAAALEKKQEDILKSQQNTFLQMERAALAAGDKILAGVNPFMIDMKTVMKNFQEQMDKSWSFIKEKILAPANQYVKDVFGIDLGAVMKTVTGAFNSLVTAAGNLWTKFTGLNTTLDKLIVGLSTILGAVAGFVVGGPAGAIAGAAAAAAGATYLLPSDGPKEPKPTTSEASSAWGNVGIPGKSMGPATRGAAFDPRRIDRGGSLVGNTSGLDPELQKRLMAAAEVYGKPLTISSGFRSSAKQKELYEDYKAGRSRFPAAPPGSSKHESGMAVDIAEYKDPAAVAALRSQGLMQTVSGDPVHFEVSGPKTEAASGSSSASGTSVQSSAPTTTAMSSSDDTLIRVMVDMRNSLNSKMQEMVDKVSESNGILEKIMRRS
jgi:hypothetical protein